MNANVFPMTKSIRIKYDNDKELNDLLKALRGIPGMDVTVNKYRG